MTKLTFETATLADVIKRAAAIAPTRGDALDRTAGIIFKIQPDRVTVMATDTTVFYMESAACQIEDAPTAGVTWRLPSIVLASVTSKLPVGSGNTVTLDDKAKPPKVVMRSKRTVVELNLLDIRHYPPLWSGFDPANLTAIPNFGLGIKQVLWAASKADPTLGGVALFPDNICATDRFRMARVEMNTGLESMIIVPGRILSRVIPENGEIHIGTSGNTFLVSPNPFIQISTVMMSTDNFPPVQHVLKKEFDSKSSFSRNEFQAMISRATDFTGGDRQAKLSVYLGRGEIALHMNNDEVGLFGDIADATGSAADHRRMKIDFNPTNLSDAVATFPGETITMMYNQDRTSAGKRSIKFTNEGHYASIIQPLVVPAEAKED